MLDFLPRWIEKVGMMGPSLQTKRKIEAVLVRILPVPMVRSLGFLYGLTVKQKSYSQFGEDLILKTYFDQVGIERGVYVDIGGFHPTWISNTHLLHKQGWTGFVIDIDAFKLRAFQLMRGGRCQTLTGAVHPEPEAGGTVTVYKFKRLWSEIDTLSEAAAQTYRRDFGIDYYVEQVPILDIWGFFRTLGKVNLINIDIEGMDESLLLHLDLAPLSPEAIVLEDNENWGGSMAIREYLESRGYERLFVSAGSVGFAKPPKVVLSSASKTPGTWNS